MSPFGELVGLPLDVPERTREGDPGRRKKTLIFETARRAARRWWDGDEWRAQGSEEGPRGGGRVSSGTPRRDGPPPQKKRFYLRDEARVRLRGEVEAGRAPVFFSLSLSSQASRGARPDGEPPEGARAGA